jgi:hypothetical protein
MVPLTVMQALSGMRAMACSAEHNFDNLAWRTGMTTSIVFSAAIHRPPQRPTGR